MKLLLSLLKIVRINNALIAGCAVLLGYWLSRSDLPSISLLLLFCTALVSTGFGNVINDIRDIVSDEISHPNRPLPRGDISLPCAWIYCMFLAIASIVFSFSISFTHGVATLLPLIILTLYSFFLKGIPLIGNIVVASLVAYSILFGAINADGFGTLIIPAILAFLLNLSREIIKDIQDEDGDRAIQVFTSAKLPLSLLKTLIYSSSLLYICLLFLPALRGDFGIVYIIVCSILIFPIHLFRLFQIRSSTWKIRLSRISFLYKIEMICGLLSLAADKLFIFVK